MEENAIQRDIGRLEGKVDALVLILTDHIKKDEQAWSKVIQIENKIWWAAGIASTLFFIISGALSGVLKKLGLGT